MDTDQRIQALESDMRVMKNQVQATLAAIREILPEQPLARSRWQKKAWVLALVNMMLAVVLFANVYLYLPNALPLAISPLLAEWLRALWLVLALVWLLLQMYPLALVLEQEDREWQNVVWRNATTFIRAQPGTLVVLTVVVLLVGIVNLFIPEAWLIVALALLVAVASLPMRQMVDALAARQRAPEKP
jgi:hypothetical protein